ncbi:MAG: YkgJ family cysteine cluster protein [Candidatus Pacearchaeota archaeon]|jgi:Fe-S-cluster containining protein
MNLASYIMIVAALFAVYVAFFRDFVLAKRKFRCLRCGSCCKLRVRLSENEIEEMKRRGEEDFLDEGGNHIKRINGYCKFLNFNNGISSCSIEDTKPGICRKFPSKKWSIFKTVDPRCQSFCRRLW